jgi:ATP-binding cassette, subfamily C, bacterial CydC
MRPLLRILGLWRRQTVWLVAGGVVSLAALACALALMAVSGTLIAVAVAGGLLVSPLALRWLGPGGVVLRYFERLVTHDATFRALADTRVWFFRGVATRAAGGLGFQWAGDMLARLVNDIEALDGLYSRIIIPLIGTILLLPALAVLGGRVAGWLGVVLSVLFVAAAWALPLFAARAALAAGLQLAAATSGLRTATLDTLTGLREVRAFGAEGRMLAAVQAREGVLLAAQYNVAMRSALAHAGAFVCGQAAILAVLIFAGVQPVLATATLFLSVAVFEAVSGLPRAGVLAGYAVSAARRVLDSAEAALPVAEPAQPAPLPAGTDVRFENVHFAWQQDRPAVLDGLSLDVPAGARVAILGPSGAGKSTLAALLLRVASPDRGRILLGGTDIATLSSTELRTRLGWLGQTSHLFDDTIRANLLLARPDADDDALWAALDAAGIGETVRDLPDGLDTWVGEGGSKFSGGQGRRLALARALLSPAPVLILDEPCAGLDADTERAFFATLNETAGGRTIIMILHRLTGVERLDRIWRLSSGRAVAAAA